MLNTSPKVHQKLYTYEGQHLTVVVPARKGPTAAVSYPTGQIDAGENGAWKVEIVPSGPAALTGCGSQKPEGKHAGAAWRQIVKKYSLSSLTLAMGRGADTASSCAVKVWKSKQTGSGVKVVVNGA